MVHKELSLPETRYPAAWDPFRSLRRFGGMTELFEDMFGGFAGQGLPRLASTLMPKVNIRETDKEYVITAALPGVKKEDAKIKVQDGVLVISGDVREEKEEKGKDWIRHELSYGVCQRGFILPAGVHPDDVKASYKDGILTVTLPKPAEEKTRGVNIKVE